MNKHLIKPLAIGVGLALATAGASAAERGTSVSVSASDIDVIPDQPLAFNLDNQYNACEDFANYVNAKWNEANPIPSDETRWGAFGRLHKKSLQQQRVILVKAAHDAANNDGSALEQKLGRLYAAGMDTDAINKLGYTPIKSKLAQIDDIGDSGDIVNFIDTSYNEGDSYVFRFGSGADFQDATRQIGYVHQSGLGLPTRAYYLEDKYQDIRDGYVKYMTRSLALIGAPEDQAQQRAKSVLAFETKLAKASLTPTQMRDLDNQYHFVTVDEADKISPHFSWEKFFKAQGVDIGKGFSLSQPKFIAEFDKLLANAPISQWQAYLKVHLISSASPYLSDAFQKNHFSFYNKTLSGQPERKARWKRVLSGVNNAMGMGLGELYVAQYFPPETKARAEQLVKNVRVALKQHIKHLDWMSDETKQKALKKWSLFLPKIGYPDEGEWRDWSGLEIQPGHWFANMEAASKYNYHYDIAKIGDRTDRKEWFMTPQTINAYYNPSTNTINFPAAILQPPFFYAHGDDAVNYGGIGFVIGHESSHGFDDQGSQFDGHGNRVNWWTDEDKKQFDARTKALAKQYSSYTPIPGKPDLHVKGKLTLGEAIGDLGGLNIAYTALQTALKKNPEEDKKIDGLTPEQRFFLSSARVWEGTARQKTAELLLNVDPHAPAKVRAFASASNMPRFSEAFQCKTGAGMARKNPVKIW